MERRRLKVLQVLVDFDGVSIAVQKGLRKQPNGEFDMDKAVLGDLFSKSMSLLKKVVNFFEHNKKGREEIVAQWPEIGRFLDCK